MAGSDAGDEVVNVWAEGVEGDPQVTGVPFEWKDGVVKDDL